MLYEVMKAGGTSTVIVPSSAVESMTFGGLSGLTALAKEAAQSGGTTPAAPTPAGPAAIPGDGTRSPTLPGV